MCSHDDISITLKIIRRDGDDDDDDDDGDGDDDDGGDGGDNEDSINDDNDRMMYSLSGHRHKRG